MVDPRGVDPLDAYSQVVTSVAAALQPSVLSVLVRNRRGGGAGSAVAFTDDGLLLTSAHVVDGVSGGGVVAADGEEAPFEVLGADRLSELAVLRTRGHIAPRRRARRRRPRSRSDSSSSPSATPWGSPAR